MKYDYDVIVIGAGSAGLVASKTVRGFGKKVALIEKDRVGGVCTNTGCIPSKALIKSGREACNLSRIGKEGLSFRNPAELNTDKVMASVRETINRMHEAYKPGYFEKLGIELIFGEAKFRDSHEVDVSGRRLSASKFIIATGTSAAVPDIDGIEQAPYITNETVFKLEKIPASVAVLGGGPVGIELAQSFGRLGSKVTVVEMLERILSKEEREISLFLEAILKSEGIGVLTNSRVTKIETQQDKAILTVNRNGIKEVLPAVDYVLVSAGRKPNIKLELENSGVTHASKGIITNDYLRTSAENIYACGDVTGHYLFSHMAEYEAVVTSINSSFPVKRKADYRQVIWSTFCDPEIAHQGLTEEEARSQYGDRIRVRRYSYDTLDMAIAEREENGFAKFIFSPDYSLIGAHIVGHNACEIIHETQLMRNFGIPFTKLQSTVYSYPSYSEIIRTASKRIYLEKLQDNYFVKIARKFI